MSQAAALTAFGDFWDVAQNLIGTGKSQNGIASYSLYFCDSVMDYYAFTHDASIVALYSAEVERILRGAFAAFNTTTHL